VSIGSAIQFAATLHLGLALPNLLIAEQNMVEGNPLGEPLLKAPMPQPEGAIWPRRSDLGSGSSWMKQLSGAWPRRLWVHDRPPGGKLPLSPRGNRHRSRHRFRFASEGCAGLLLATSRNMDGLATVACEFGSRAVHLVGTGCDSHKDEARTFIYVFEWSVVDRDRPALLQQQALLADTRLWQIPS